MKCIMFAQITMLNHNNRNGRIQMIQGIKQLIPQDQLHFFHNVILPKKCFYLTLFTKTNQISIIVFMSRKDQITNKKKRVANNVSHSNRKTKRTQEINLQTKRFFIEEQNRWVKLRVTTRSIRTISKMGVLAFARKHGYTI